mmetsp:Transcript_20686/g.19698  ORF Transcript_20686/g.19698 Transcript_20686/m.19698 type:complete len:124 (+) Transcript_20686:1161-1532(+)
MSTIAPDRKIGIVTFNGEVNVLGDGSKNPHTIAGDKLKDFNFLQESPILLAKEYLSKSIKDTAKQLTAKLLALEETGPTALGPALLTSIQLASQGAPGSTVILCTDGLANVGLGAFDEVVSDE